MACDLSLRLMGRGLPSFAGWSGYASIAALPINPGIDAIGHEQTFVAPPCGALLFVVLNFARIRSDHASDSGWRDETVMGKLGVSQIQRFIFQIRP